VPTSPPTKPSAADPVRNFVSLGFQPGSLVEGLGACDALTAGLGA
jgi:hypothetical protein